MDAQTIFFPYPVHGNPPLPAIEPHPVAAPTISVLDSSAERGDGVFETFGVIAQTVQALRPHLDRLRTSAGILDLPDPDIEELTRIVTSVAALAAPDEVCALKLVLTRGGPGTKGEPSAWIVLSDMPDFARMRTDGIRTVILNKGYDSALVPQEPWLLFGAKHLSYAQHMAATREAHRRDAHEAIFATADGFLLEGPTSTLVIRQGDHLMTPDPELGVLHGTTQRDIFAYAHSQGLTTSYERLPLDALLEADAAWLLSSIRMSTPVSHVDGTEIKRDRDLTEQFNTYLINRR